MKIIENYTNKTLQKRLLALLLLIAFIFIALFCRLAYLQVFSADFLNIKAKEQWLRDVPLKAQRGNIYDRNGVCLASDFSTYDVYVRANSVENAGEVSRVLSDVLEMDFAKVEEKVRNKKISEVLIKSQVESEKALKIISKNLSGVYFSINSKRNYSFGDFLSQVLGYTTVDGVGQAGIEAYYNELLTGKNGKVLSESDVRGRGLNNTLTYYEESIKGLDLNLTIDFEIQSIVEDALEKAMHEHQAKHATGIVMDPKTGEVLAMSTKQSFNLNDVPRDDVSLLNELSKNYSVVNVVEPGSTFKLFTISCALELGLTNENERFYCPGFRVVDGQRIKCWKTIGHGSQSLTEGLCNSCNCVFMDLAQRIGTEKLYQYIRKFGFGAKTGIDVFAETSGILMNEKLVKNVDLARIGFGHAVAVSPIQMINGVCSIVNGGNLLTPYVLKSASSDKQIVKQSETKTKNQTISTQTASLVKSMMKAVVAHSNGANARVVGYNLGGKTGTAQKYENGIIAQGKYVSSFVGFGPYDNPKYVVLVMIDEPSNGVYYGSLVAAPCAKEIFANIFDVKNIEKIDEGAEEILNVSMPDITGKTVAEAISILKKAFLQFEVDGEGTCVIGQFPQKQTMLREGAVVLIKT